MCKCKKLNRTSKEIHTLLYHVSQDAIKSCHLSWGKPGGDLNGRFPYPLIYLSLRNPYPFVYLDRYPFWSEPPRQAIIGSIPQGRGGRAGSQTSRTNPPISTISLDANLTKQGPPCIRPTVYKPPKSERAKIPPIISLSECKPRGLVFGNYPQLYKPKQTTHDHHDQEAVFNHTTMIPVH